MRNVITTRTVETEVTEPLTMAKLRDAINQLPKCPFAELMESAGKPPKDGWMLFMPEQKFRGHEPSLPEYVSLSPFINEPFIVSKVALHGMRPPCAWEDPLICINTGQPISECPCSECVEAEIVEGGGEL